MIQISAPEALFSKQKVFRFDKNVDKGSDIRSVYKVVVIYETPQPELPAAQNDMLLKLIAACQFKQEEVYYINRSLLEDISLGNLQNRFSPQFILIFGEINLSRNITGIKKNAVYQLSGVKVIYTDSLVTLEKNPQAKKTLWGSLQKMLEIK
jgi:hypothetical protein